MRELLLRKQSSILSAAFIIMVTYGLAHLLGLVKSRLLISYFFGGNAALLDVYYAAMIIPETIFQLLVMGALSAAFIPIFSKYLSKNEHQAWTMAGITLNVVLAVFIGISLIIFIFARPLAGLVAPGFSLTQIAIMANLLRVMLMAQIFFCISGFLTGMIQSRERFLIPAVAPLAYNLGIILGIVFLSGTLGIYAPAVGMVMGAALHMLIQLPAALSLGFRPSLSFNIHYPGVWEVARLMPPRALAMGIDQIEQFVAIMLSSLLAAGSLSLFNVARLLYAVPTLLFGATIGQAALPSLSAQVAKQDWESFRKTLTDACLQVVFLALPVCVLFIILRVPIVRLVFGAKTFPWEATLLTGKTMAILMVSAVFYAVTQLIIRAFYALHDTRTPLLIGLIAAIFNIIFSIMTVKWWGWGILGIALALSLTAIGEMAILTVVLSSKIFPKAGIPNEVWLPLWKISLIGIITGLGLWLPMRFLDQYIFDTTRTLPLLILTIITSATGMGIYFVLSWVFKISQLSAVFGLVRRIKEWRVYLKAPAQSEPIILPTQEQN